MKPTTTPLGARLRERRVALKLPQHVVGKRAGISSARMSYYEIGARQPDPETLIALADALECTTDWLLDRSGAPELSATDETEPTNVALQNMLADVVETFASADKHALLRYYQFLKMQPALPTADTTDEVPHAD